VAVYILALILTLALIAAISYLKVFGSKTKPGSSSSEKVFRIPEDCAKGISANCRRCKRLVCEENLRNGVCNVCKASDDLGVMAGTLGI